MSSSSSLSLTSFIAAIISSVLQHTVGWLIHTGRIMLLMRRDNLLLYPVLAPHTGRVGGLWFGRIPFCGLFGVYGEGLLSSSRR